MQIQINGEQRELSPEVSTLANLIETLSLSPQRIAVEVNKTIVRRKDWDKTVLKDADQIEIVHFVGGGEDRRQTAGSRRRQNARNFCSIRERV